MNEFLALLAGTLAGTVLTSTTLAPTGNYCEGWVRGYNDTWCYAQSSPCQVPRTIASCPAVHHGGEEQGYMMAVYVATRDKIWVTTPGVLRRAYGDLAPRQQKGADWSAD